MRGKKESMLERQARMDNSSVARRELCHDLCAHLASGYSVSCFSKVTKNTLERYLKVYKEDFPPEEIEAAVMQGQAYWEGIGNKQASGQCLGNSRSWWLNMAVRYGWVERQEVALDHKGAVEVSIVNYARSKPSQPIVDKDAT